MTERERMISGGSYDPQDPELVSTRARVQRIVREYNALNDDQQSKRDDLLRGAFGRMGERVVIQSGLRFEYGFTVELGDDVFMNYGCVLLDVCPIVIGSRVLFGPNVQLLTPTHPLDPEERATGLESGRAIGIGDDVWLGGGAIVNPGVTIGSGTTVGAGSVVTRDLPDRVFAAGSPARVIREL